MKSHKDLDVWNKAIELVTEVYKVTKDFPRDEVYGITSQLRRAVVSITSNISEGAGRSSRKEFSHFLSISLGSISETETHLIICQKLGYLTDKEFDYLDQLLTNIRQMTIGLKKYIDNSTK